MALLSRGGTTPTLAFWLTAQEREQYRGEALGMAQAASAGMPGAPGGGRFATIRRGSALSDGFGQLGRLGDARRGRVRVAVVSEAGLAEAGGDGGGLFKEFVEEVRCRCCCRCREAAEGRTAAADGLHGAVLPLGLWLPCPALPPCPLLLPCPAAVSSPAALPCQRGAAVSSPRSAGHPGGL